MKHTIKIDPLRALVIEPQASNVLVRITAAGVALFSQTITADQAQALADALQLSAERVAS